MEKNDIKAINQVANKIADSSDADILLVNGSIDRPLDRLVIDACHKRSRRNNVVTIESVLRRREQALEMLLQMQEQSIQNPPMESDPLKKLLSDQIEEDLVPASLHCPSLQ